MFIIFLVILLLLTFFSNTILNYSLPEVSAQYANYGTLSTAIKANGTVKANESYNVIYEEAQAEADGGVVQSRKVLSVYVKEGQTVEKDAPILQLQGGASQQLEAVQKQYDELKRTYDLALLDDQISGLQSDKTLSDAKKAIADAEEKITELKVEYNALLGGSDTTSVIEAKIERLEEQMDAVDEYIKDCEDKIGEIDGNIQQANSIIEKDILSKLTVSEKLEAAEKEYSGLAEAYEMLKYDVEYYEEQLNNIKNTQTDIGEANTLTNQLESLEDQLYSLEKTRDRYVEDYKKQNADVNADYYDLLDAYENAKEKYDDYADEYQTEIDQLKKLQSAANSAGNAYNQLMSNRSAYETALENYEDAVDSYRAAITTLANAQTSGNEDAITAAQNAVALWEQEVADCQVFLAAAEINNPTDEEIDAAASASEKANEDYQYVSNLSDGLSSLELDMNRAKQALDNASWTETDHTEYKRKLDDYDEQIEDLEDDIAEVKDKLAVIGMPEVDNVINYATDYDLATVQKNYDTASKKLSEVTADYEKAKTEVESLRKQSTAEGIVAEYKAMRVPYEEQLENLENEKEALEKQITAAEKELSGASSPKDPEDVLEEIEATEDNLAELKAQLQIT
ncbi:MAG: hypothetical protein IJY35_05860, partial [Clostridia bacterium]|nr:hypothetical protein [Clostridia bacterium]